jgi:hypothetical protein
VSALIGWTCAALATVAAAGLGLVLWQQDRGVCCPHPEAGAES